MAFATDTYVIKGMRQDDSDLLFNGNKEGLSFAFENLNMRFTTDTETTSLVATQEKGNSLCKLNLSDQYFDKVSDISSNAWFKCDMLPFRVIGHCEIDKYLVLFGKCLRDYNILGRLSSVLTFEEGQDVIIRFERIDEQFYGWILYQGEELNFNVKYPLETIGNVETNLIKKVYFVDGINVPRSVNVVNKDAGILSNINLGFSLSLNDVFTVTKDYSINGNFPMGKIRFFYTYFNDNFSETNIVDWSPFFDCNGKNQGGSPDSRATTQFAFRVHIDNVDTQFKFVRIYFQHFTKNDPSAYQLKYVERAIADDTFDAIITFDATDIQNATETYLDRKVTSYTFIPYTFAEKNNRLFYGNIKKHIPDVSDISFSNCADIEFDYKEIGYEDLSRDTVYQYESDNTTFKGSNFDYMGFRKDNWYRFGIIAQYYTGEWSTIMFIADKKCNLSSKTEVEYNFSPKTYSTNSSTTLPHQPISRDNYLSIPTKTPAKSKYYIPNAHLVYTDTTSFKQTLKKLRGRGYIRIKPVCVVPPASLRGVITQGISCSTLYTGKYRRLLNNQGLGLFSIPSYFFRPLPLYQIENIIEQHEGYRVFKPKYPYTLRKIDDLTLPNNIKDNDGNWLLNPTFDNESYMHYNMPFREYRHGFSLPPKDRINAELQNSDFSMHDYFYNINDNGHISVAPLISDGVQDGINLFGFFVNNDHKCYFQKFFDYTIDYSNANWPYAYMAPYQVLPYHDVYTNGYDNLTFIDENICTLNSPEIDFRYATDIKPFYKNELIKTVGYAQVTNSAVVNNIPNKQFEISEDNDTIDISNNMSDKVGKCLFNISYSDNKTLDYLKRLTFKGRIQNQPFVPTCGPWWLDTLLVNCFRRSKIYALQPSSNKHLFSWLNNREYMIADDESFDLNDYNLYDSNVNGPDDTAGLINVKKGAAWFSRGFDNSTVDGAFRFTNSFYGETNVFNNENQNSNNIVITPDDGTTYPHTNKNHLAVFCEFTSVNPTHASELHDNYCITDTTNTLKKLSVKLSRWVSIPLSLNVLKTSGRFYDDGYWANYDENRTKLLSSKSSIPAGNVTLSSAESNGTMYDDLIASIYNDDFRLTQSYYFFPYFDNSKSNSFYKTTTTDPNKSSYIRIHHPWILPLTSRHDWYSEIQNTPGIFDNMSSIAGCETSTLIPYFEGSEYGCHYYAPFSTNFVGGYFEPYYAHVVYPFMDYNSNVPFCGTLNAHCSNTSSNRPAYNSTHSLLYSNCTNYVKSINIDTNEKTYSAYYNNPNITQENSEEPDLSDIPFLPTGMPYVYSYEYTTENIPTLLDKTYTLTAAMKWYRGFKSLDDNSTDKLTSNGCVLNKSNIAGNLLFSGYLPQFYTKNGLLGLNRPFTTGQEYPLLNYQTMVRMPANDFQTANSYLSSYPNRSIRLQFNSMAHVVYCNLIENDNIILRLLDKFYADTPHLNILTDSYVYNFKPQFYYKEFINNQIINQYNFDTNDYGYTNEDLPYIAAYHTMKSIYPHTGHFEQYHFDPLIKSSKPYWNINDVVENYPEQIEEPQLKITATDTNLIRYDSNGYRRLNENYWLLPISNMYNMQNVTNNPYTSSGISNEEWNWKMCGDTISVADILYNESPIRYLEGDTYFQRYNCFKTISDDKMQTPNDSDEDLINSGNDVTEAASVMIESYINLDGLYWNYNNLMLADTSPLLHPFYSLADNINPVYSIQNDLCDIFKDIDQNYYNAHLEHYPTQIMWSVQKQDGENIDSWGVVPATNKMLVSGEMGSITKLISYADKVFCLQDHGLSVLNYNSQVISPTTTDSLLSVYLSDSTKLQDVTYVSRTNGTLNKWSVAIGANGIYWIDDTMRQFCHYGPHKSSNGLDGRSILVDMSSNYGFKAWSNAVISSDNCVWDANVFLDTNNAFKANYDFKNNDLYWANGECCICFNEKLDCFTSFYNYEKIPYKLNYLDECYSIENFDTESKLWHDYSNYRHSLYDHDIDSYIELLVNPSGQYDKVFNFIEYYTEMYDFSKPYDVAHAKMNPYNYIRVNNTYQIGYADLNHANTQNRFKLWRTTLPREIKDGKLTMNRIRSPWCKIKLQHKPTSAGAVKEYRDKLHYINVNYTIPEQPLKTNMRQ